MIAPRARTWLLLSLVALTLKFGDASAQQTPPPGMNLIDLTVGLNDFADTAGLISQLDLVIAVDTAIAHLTGALGKPIWVLGVASGGLFLTIIALWIWMGLRANL